ncbi:embryonic polyadenylate-binding protein 2 isoform X3 [Fukomys damarensis]|uniref:embryonic polyadenylate-binding protein 2 isoform X3 n=1 Tax=Fukomys damarensis TaxID=885580 RepID=UPI0005401F12|nr:embryonic polyadenylate-binding protein 2 isoform X3 [Fukomys damarensis]
MQELQELEAIKLKLWTMEQAQAAPEPPSTQTVAKEEEAARARQLLSPETVGSPFPMAPRETVEADYRSIYVGNVDYSGTAEELEAHFHPCGEVHRVTILCDKFSGHPKGSVQGCGGAQAVWTPLAPPRLTLPHPPAMPMWSSPPGAQPWPLHSWMRASFGAGSSRCSPRGPTSQASAPQTAGASGGTWAPGQHPSYAAASRAGPGSDHVGRAGAVEDSPRGSRHTEATSDSTWGQGWGRSQQLCALGPLIPDRPGLQP